MILTRFAYTATHTLGWLEIDDLRLATLERPWIPAEDHRGGAQRISCVPDGTYQVVHHSGPRFSNVFALINEDLDVHHMPGPVGRSAILIHQGNRVRDVVGCIAVGEHHGDLAGETAVLRSAMAMTALRHRLANKALPSLTIRPTLGTASGCPWR